MPTIRAGSNGVQTIGYTSHFPCRLKKYREEAKFTQKGLSSAIGISLGTYGVLEQGLMLMSVDMLEMLCDFLGVMPDHIYPPIVLVIMGIYEAEEWVYEGGVWEE